MCVQIQIAISGNRIHYAAKIIEKYLIFFMVVGGIGHTVWVVFILPSVIRVGKGRRVRRLKTIDKWLSLTGNERLKRQSISRKDEG
jgi:Trk-type K+ transport system membrane component